MIFCREPTLKETLSDPLIRTVMAADGVDAAELETMLTAVARKLARKSGSRTAASAGPQEFACLASPWPGFAIAAITMSANKGRTKKRGQSLIIGATPRRPNRSQRENR